MILPDKMTYKKALWIPFAITPIASIVQLCFRIINLIAAPIGVLVMAHFIDTTLDVLQVLETNNDASNDWSRVVPPLLMLCIFNLYKNITIPFLNLLNQRQRQKAWLAIDHSMVKTYASLEVKHMENRDTVDLINRVWAAGPSATLTGVWDVFSGFVFNVGWVVSYVIILFAAAPVAGAFVIAATLPVVIMAKKSAKEKFKTHQDLTHHYRMEGGHLHFLFNRESVSERKMFGYTPYMWQKYIDVFWYIRKAKFAVEMKWTLRDNLVNFLLVCIGATALLMMLPLIRNGSVSVGMLIALMGVLFSTLSYVTWNLSDGIQGFARQRAYLNEFNQYMELSRTHGALDPIAEASTIFDTLTMQNVSFSYPDTNKQVLNNISLTIEAGKCYAIVGTNGCGKTTLAKLILRLYEEYTGEILLNGESLSSWPLPHSKAMFTAVFQNFAQFDISLSDNISIGSGMQATEHEIDLAIDVMGLRPMVNRLHKGKNTLVGKIYDESIELSAGQWQRVSMARAVVSSAQVKILDEPTASLDPLAEQELYAQFSKISRGAATIFISHRLASARMADMIFVMDKGKIVEQGTHETLLRLDGFYANMFRSQQGWYQ